MYEVYYEPEVFRPLAQDELNKAKERLIFFEDSYMSLPDKDYKFAFALNKECIRIQKDIDKYEYLLTCFV